MRLCGLGMRPVKLKRGEMGYNHFGWSHYLDGVFQSFIMPWGINNLHDYGFVSENNRERFNVTTPWARNIQSLLLR